MYKYLANLDEESTHAVINSEGRLCVFASNQNVKEDVVLRHYAFLLDFMTVPVEKILLVCMDSTIVKKLKGRFHRRYKGLPCQITPIGEVGDASLYEYVLVYDAHNVDVFSAKQLVYIYSNVTNFIFCK